MIICVKLTKLEAKMLAEAVDRMADFIDEPTEFTGDWPRGERAAIRRTVEKLRAALPPKETTHANPS